MKALLRGLVAAYLLYLAWKLGGQQRLRLSHSGPAAGGRTVCRRGCHFWRVHLETDRSALKEAKLTPEELAELDKDDA